MRVLATRFVVLFALLTAAPAFAQWSSQAPLPTALELRGVAAPTPQRVFVTSADNPFDDGGALFESTDGGATWTHRDVPFNLNDPLNGLFFFDSQLGWAHGNDNYRTTDGGTTWEELPFLGSTYLMEFYTPSFGYASTNGERWLSRDGGLTWDINVDSLTAFDFANDQLGLASTAVRDVDNGLYRSTDGGATFALVQPGRAPAVAFLSSTLAVGIVDDAFVRSTDGGLTWTEGEAAEGRIRLTPLGLGVVLAWGRSGTFPNYDERLFRSTDGGQTWTDLGEIFDEGPERLTVVDDQTVLAMDRQGNLARSADAGLTWTTVFETPGPRPSAFGRLAPTFADTQTGYHALGRGYVVKTSDGGATWNQVSSGYGETLNAIERFPNGDLIAVGEHGTLLTNAGGDAPWVLQDALTNQHMKGAHVLGAQSVMVADYHGRVYHSADGGMTWTAPSNEPPLTEAYDLFFHTPLDGWVVGSSGASGSLLHTTDGGATWTPGVRTGGNPVIGVHVGIDFVGDDGWATGSSGRYYRTADAGATWVEGNLPGFPNSISDMDFFDANVGYAVGSFGYAVRSDDGGVTWTELPTPNDDSFSDIYLIGPDEVWLSTDEGVAYYSATGGQNWAVLDSEVEDFGFLGIVASPDGDAWMAGFSGFITHFDGPPGPPLNRPPVASYEFETTGLTVTFTDTSTDPDGTVESWFWDFGDSAPDSTSTEQNPTHTFEAAGTYTVRLTVTDDDGASDGFLRFIVVQTGPGGTFGDFTEVTPLDPLFVTPQDEDFWVATTAPADYDSDGDLDIAVLGYYVVYGESVVERLVLLRNGGEDGPESWNFEYVDLDMTGLSSGSSDMVWGDLDGDGDQDLVVGTDGETVIYRNDDGSLVRTDSALPGYLEDNLQADFDLQSITLADFDNDGDPDLLLPSAINAGFQYRTALMRNDGLDGAGDFVFTETDSTFAPTEHAQSIWADYDSDGDTDLLLVHLAPLTPNGFIRRYRNDGDGVFVGEDILGDLTIEHGEAQWGDYDADGDYDILVAGNLGEIDGTFTRAALRIYENDGDTFTPFEVIPSPSAEGWFEFTAATWADYDADGDVDILLTGTHNPGTGQIEGRARIYINEGGTFTGTEDDLPAPRSSGTRGGTFTWLDIDGEGDLDYFIAGDYWVPGGNGLVEAQMHLYRYDATGSNAAPNRPSGMQAAVDDATGTVTLTWDAASDDSTPTEALTYDLDLRRDGMPIASPQRLPQPGNVSAATGWVLTGLPDGVYRWRLRTVDSAFNGSTPTEGVFGVGVDVPIEGEDTLPTAFALEAAYPNPFRETTTFTLALPASADVELTVYDVLGRRVARLLNGPQAAGHHEVRWGATGLPSGTYLVRLSTDTRSVTRRILLVR